MQPVDAWPRSPSGRDVRCLWLQFRTLYCTLATQHRGWKHFEPNVFFPTQSRTSQQSHFRPSVDSAKGSLPQTWVASCCLRIATLPNYCACTYSNTINIDTTLQTSRSQDVKSHASHWRMTWNLQQFTAWITAPRRTTGPTQCYLHCLHHHIYKLPVLQLALKFHTACCLLMAV